MGRFVGVETPPYDDASLNMASRTYFRLPDGETEIWIAGTTKGISNEYTVGSGNAVLARWASDGVQTRLSPAMVNDDLAEFGDVFNLCLVSDAAPPWLSEAADGSQRELGLAWAAVYALRLHPDRRGDQVIAVSTDSDRVGEYMRCTGLGTVSPFTRVPPPAAERQAGVVYWLHRAAFWQGAGAPDSQHWLRARPEVTAFPGFNGTLGVFASQLGFTRRGNVCAVHPVRPPKPPPGAVVYSRFIVELGQQLRIRHIDAANPAHFATYARWQNSDRVHAAWRERGPDEHHAAYLARQLADPHTMACVFEWDGELAGYTELGWVREDNAACFFGAGCGVVIGEHDQNSHILVGEERFRGGKRYQAVATSIKHCCFLREPRTAQVIAEPQFDLSHVAIQSKYLPQERKKVVHLPHKTAVLFALQRDRFFQEAHFV